MGKTSLSAILGLGRVMELAPRPRHLAGDMIKPFVVILGGLALYLAALCLLVGQDPTHVVSSFLAGSAETLAPFAAFLLTTWAFYVATYVLVGAPFSELSILARTPGWFAAFLRRLHLWLPGSMFAVCLIVPSSLVRLYRPYLPVRAAMGWRAGDSVQLE